MYVCVCVCVCVCACIATTFSLQTTGQAHLAEKLCSFYLLNQ